MYGGQSHHTRAPLEIARKVCTWQQPIGSGGVDCLQTRASILQLRHSEISTLMRSLA